MKIRTGNYLLEVGQRLAIVRNEARLTRSDMARKLGIHPNNYYKHEVGDTLPCLDTLSRLQNEFDISLDWLLFKKEPMYLRARQLAVVEKMQANNLEAELPDVKDLVTDMEQDQVLRYEILLYYSKYKKAQRNGETPPPSLAS